MTHPAPAPPADGRSRWADSTYLTYPSDHLGAHGDARAVVPTTGITVYGCGPEEATLFRELAPRFGLPPTITDAAVSEDNADLASGTQCISVGHKTNIDTSTLVALSKVGVRYISSRSVGHDHIDVHGARTASGSL